MSVVLIHRVGPRDAGSTRAFAAPVSATVAPARRPSPAKMSVESAWAAWQANCAGSSGGEFLRGVSSWTEGTAAQLLRQRWPAGVERPTSGEVEERLRQFLGLAASGGHSTYLDALAWARRGVIEELGRARQAQAAVSEGTPDV